MSVEPPNRILRVDLTTETVTSEQVPPRWRRQYIGGKGLGARYLYEEVDAGADPLGPDNVLLFLLGPLSGMLPGDARYAAVTKSPLTGTFLDSYSGGEFAGVLADALSDHVGLLVTGASDRPVRLDVENGTVSIEDARELAGADTIETDEAFPDAAVACIGPAGERGVRYATISADSGEHHAGRGGAGAVMGSKRLKAIVARGDPDPQTGAKEALTKKYAQRYLESDVGRWYQASGTLETVDFANEVGVLSTRGWQAGVFDGTDDIGIEAARRTAVGRERERRAESGAGTDRKSRFETTAENKSKAERDDEYEAESESDLCLDLDHGPDSESGSDRDFDSRSDASSDHDSDSIATGDPVYGDFRVELDDGEYVPRGATAMSLGAGLAIDDFDAVATLGQTCDRYGIDVISVGNALAWAVRASEMDVIDHELSFGDEDELQQLVEAIATREEGLGDALADGVASAADTLGGSDLIPTIKSMEVPSYDPRGSVGMALAYATSDRGACHRRSLPVEREALEREAWTDADRIRVVLHEQNVYSVLWSLVADDFSGNVLTEDLGADLLSAVGLAYELDELLLAGERIWTLTRLFNVREGFDRSDDTLPPVFSEPLQGGPADGRAIDDEDFELLLQGYYTVRGWSETGIPSRSLLEYLDLLDIVDDETPVATQPAQQPPHIHLEDRPERRLQ